VPVMEEVLVVTKQLVLTEEVRIRTKRVTEEQEVYEILRRERVRVEDATAPGSRRSDDEPSVDHANGTHQKPGDA
jgi:stress response protein YsnF